MNSKNRNKSVLKLPIITRDTFSSIRPADEVRQTIEELFPDLFNREIYEKEKRRMSVNVRFCLKGTTGISMET